MTEYDAALMRNRAGNFSIGRLMEFLTALGQDVKITVKPTRKAVGEMEMEVEVVVGWIVGWAERSEAHRRRRNHLEIIWWARCFAP